MNKRALSLLGSTLALSFVCPQPVAAEAQQTVIIIQAIENRVGARTDQLPTERRDETVPRPEREPAPENVRDTVAEGRCPEDYFTPEEIAAAQNTRFAFPIPNPVPEIVPEPAVVHKDHGPNDQDPTMLNCIPYAEGHVCYDGHGGTDFMLSLHVATMAGNVEVRAAADGIVRNVVDGNADLCSWTPAGIKCLRPEDPWNFDQGGANKVDLCHVDGKRTQYLHLMKGSVKVEVGQRVKCGELLGYVGSSGYSSAPHLHFDVMVRRKNSTRYDRVDPYSPNDANSHWVDQKGGAFGTLPGGQCQ